MLTAGVFIYLPKGVKVEQPIALVHYQSHMNQALHIRHLIIAEEQVDATVIEEYSGAKDCCYFTNTITEISLARKRN